MGGMGAILWILFLVFIGAVVTKVLRNMPADRSGRFIAFASSLTTVFLWVSLVLYVPSHAILFLTFAFTGIFLAATVNMSILKPYNIAFVSAYSRKFILPAGSLVVLVLVLIIVFAYGKKTIALLYFVSGLKSINQTQDYVAADAAFHKALIFDKSDAYWRAISENHRLHASQIISTATSSSPEIANAVAKEIVDGVEAAQNATKYNPSNYYNPFSEARISQLGASIKMDKAYDNAVRAYTNAINLNPFNPSLYANLAQLQASNEKYDDALQSLGAALQVKNNYLDAVFLLSQVHAARNDLPNAIIAAKVAIQLNPQNSILYFQLGLLYYNSANYDESYKALSKAVELQPDYANAKYFLGLAAARNGNTAVAIEQFKSLSASNPENQEITQILNTLRSGKSLFQTTPASGAEKRSVLPVKEKR
jgi:tetratricopeptide (TPR) repeat protein